MKKLYWAVGSLLVVVIILSVFFVRINRIQTSGDILLPGLLSPVKISRDEKGMAYIYAENLSDALTAQGFVTAQDRLFQMELTRLMAQGRISELAGKKTVQLDIRTRTLGFHRQAKKHAAILSAEEKKHFECYLRGLNYYIDKYKKYHPVSFNLAGIKPKPWKISDILSIGYYMGWESAANLKTELVTQMLIDKVGPERAVELFPLNTNPDDKNESVSLLKNKVGKIASATGINLSGDINLKGYLEHTNSLNVGSNNWVVGPERSRSGKPLVANDPHLDPTLQPGPWYPSGIIIPGLRAVGVTVAGLPGMVVGRTNNVSYGVTNSYGDGQDLYIETVDPERSGNYLEGKSSIPFEKIDETILYRDGDASGGYFKKTITVLKTRRGPVISNILPGLNTKKVITVRWSPYETMLPETGLLLMLRAKSVSEVRSALSKLTFIMLNFVFADTQGNIGWHTTGKLPIRSQGESITPYAVKDSIDNWKGWIPFDKMPSDYNPEKGWLGTCNHNTVKKNNPYYISSYFSPHYRYSRLKEICDSYEKRDPLFHWNLQRDTKNILAVSITPIIKKALLAEKDTEFLGKILGDWDYTDSRESYAPSIFQSIYRNIAIETFRDELGDELTDTMLSRWYVWQERLENMILQGESDWFDDVSTKEKKETLSDIIHRSALKAVKDLGEKFGSNPVNWKWGEMHTIEFINPLMRSGILKWIFGGGSFPMSGSGETLYRGLYKFEKPFAVKYAAALRMVADLADDDKILAVLPWGVSGRIFSKHNSDQMEKYMSGEPVYWWFSDSMIKRNGQKNYRLVPAKK
jgi:penicillin G amidase